MINGFFPGSLQPDAVVAGCVNIFENVWPNPHKTINDIETDCTNPESSVSWFRAETIGNGANQSVRTNLNMNITDLALNQNSGLMQNVHNQFNMILLASTLDYVKRYNLKENLYHEHYNILKYKENQEYKEHYDGGSDIGRCISAVLYLNDNFDNGELEFVNFGVKIKPQSGMLVLFPSNFVYSHIAHPVSNGCKYALVTWIRDKNV